jgi:hypothetical protein
MQAPQVQPPPAAAQNQAQPPAAIQTDPTYRERFNNTLTNAIKTYNNSSLSPLERNKALYQMHTLYGRLDPADQAAFSEKLNMFPQTPEIQAYAQRLGEDGKGLTPEQLHRSYLRYQIANAESNKQIAAQVAQQQRQAPISTPSTDPGARLNAERKARWEQQQARQAQLYEGLQKHREQQAALQQQAAEARGQYAYNAMNPQTVKGNAEPVAVYQSETQPRSMSADYVQAWKDVNTPAEQTDALTNVTLESNMPPVKPVDKTTMSVATAQQVLANPNVYKHPVIIARAKAAMERDALQKKQQEDKSTVSPVPASNAAGAGGVVAANVGQQGAPTPAPAPAEPKPLVGTGTAVGATLFPKKVVTQPPPNTETKAPDYITKAKTNDTLVKPWTVLGDAIRSTIDNGPVVGAGRYVAKGLDAAGHNWNKLLRDFFRGSEITDTNRRADALVREAANNPAKKQELQSMLVDPAVPIALKKRIAEQLRGQA